MLRKISISLCLMAVFLMVVTSQVGAVIKLFDDVYSNDWYARDVYSLVEHGVISGYPDNTFKGEENITRAEFVTMLVNSDEVKIVPSSESNKVYLSDISNHWAEEYIITATEKGFIAGYGDGTFKPDEPITREESFSIIARVIRLKNMNLSETEVGSFTDENECSSYALEDIRFLHRVGIVNGYDDGSVKPKDNITRGETSSLFRRFMGYEEYQGDIGNVTRPLPTPPEPEPTLTLLGTHKITFYCPNGCCGSPGGITASGNIATPYKTVAMKGLPFGTIIRIEFSRADLQYLNGDYVVEDRGVGSGVVDVCMPYHSLCYELGVDRGAKVYIVE